MLAGDGTVLRANGTLLRWLDRAAGDVLGAPFPALLTRGSGVLWQTLTQPALLGEGRASSSLELVRADGRVLPALVHAVAPPGGPVRLTVFDATERRAYEAGLLAARDAAEAAEHDLLLLQAVSAACARAGSPEALLEQVLEVVAEAVPAQGCGVWLARGDRLAREAALDLATGVGDDAVHAAWRRGDLVSDASASGTVLAVPLREGARVLGVLGLLLAPGQELSPRRCVVLGTAGDQVAAALSRARLHAEAVERQAFTAALLDNVAVGIVACDAQGHLTTFNGVAREWHGLDADAQVPPADLPRHYDLVEADGQTPLDPSRVPLHRALREGHVVDVEIVIAPRDRPATRVLCTGQQLHDDDGRVLGAVVAMQDVTRLRDGERALRESAAFHDAVLVASPDPVFLADPVTGALVWSSRAGAGVLTELGSLPERVVHSDDAHRLRAADTAARGLGDGEVLQVRYRLRDAAGEDRWVARRVTPFLRDADGEVVQVLATARDITDVVQAEERLRAAALHDPLTGLPNRALLSDRLGLALSRSGRSRGGVAVLFCDLDGFKLVNDTAGHAAGDEVLRAVASRITGVLRPADTVARVGGDEFVVLLEPHPDAAVLHEDALAVAERLRAEVGRPVPYDGRLHRVSASVGVAFAAVGDDPGQVLRDADHAMYAAKQGGRDRAEVHSPLPGGDARARAAPGRDTGSSLDGHRAPAPG